MLKDSTVIVTGGAKGIGKAIALAFAAHGANITLNDMCDEPVDTMEEIRDCGVRCLYVHADVGDFAQAGELIKAAKDEFGSIDVLVNNAGITRDNLLVRMSEEDFDSVIKVNLKGTFNTIRHVAGVMLKQRSGVIINMSSVSGVAGNAGQVNYSASKAGIIGITKTIAREFASRGVTCNAIAPGFIDTDMTRSLSDGVKERIIEQIPLDRFGQPEDVAQAAVFLALNRYITGMVLHVDGGMII